MNVPELCQDIAEFARRKVESPVAVVVLMHQGAMMVGVSSNGTQEVAFLPQVLEEMARVLRLGPRHGERQYHCGKCSTTTYSTAEREVLACPKCAHPFYQHHRPEGVKPS